MDAGIVAGAREASAWARGERDHFRLLGSDVAAASELLGAGINTERDARWIAVEGMRVYLSSDAKGTCRGLYVVGSDGNHRSLDGKTWTPDRILSQALGHAATVKRPTEKSPAVSNAVDGGTPIVARWNVGQLVELRIADASP